MLFELVLLAILVLYIYFKNQKPDGLPPGPWGLPLVGVLYSGKKSMTAWIAELRKKHGDVFSIRIGTRLFVFLADFNIIKTAFNKPELQNRPDFISFRTFSFLENIGLVNSDGLVWQTGRRFALRQLRDLGLGKSRLQHSIQQEAEALVAHLEQYEGSPVELSEIVNLAVLNVIWKLVADRRFEVNDPDMIQLVKALEKNIDIIQGPVKLLDVMPWLIDVLPVFIQNKFMEVDKIAECRDQLYAFLEKEVRRHEETLDPDNPRDYIDHYMLEISEQEDQTDSIFRDDKKDLKAAISDLFGAGSESTSSMLRWFFLYMAKFPEIQAKIQGLIDEVVPADRLPTLEDRDRLNYLDATIMDVLRLCTLVPQGIPHTAAVDITLEKYHIPKGTIVMPCMETCHKNSKYWEHPQKLHPEHFLQDGKLLTKKNGFLLFSIGRRQCLGESLARMELYLFTAAILQRFLVCAAPGETLSTEVDQSKELLNFAPPFKVILTKRHKTN